MFSAGVQHRMFIFIQDAPKPGAGKHIVFGSDDDEDDDDKAENVEKKQSTSEATTKKTLFQDSQSEDDSTDDEASANENKTIKEKVRERGYITNQQNLNDHGDLVFIFFLLPSGVPEVVRSSAVQRQWGWGG